MTVGGVPVLCYDLVGGCAGVCVGGGWSPGGPGVGAGESGHVGVCVSFVVGCRGGLRAGMGLYCGQSRE